MARCTFCGDPCECGYAAAAEVTEELSVEQVRKWKEEAKQGMTSAIWEYCPAEFITLADAYIALASAKAEESST